MGMGGINAGVGIVWTGGGGGASGFASSGAGPAFITLDSDSLRVGVGGATGGPRISLCARLSGEGAPGVPESATETRFLELFWGVEGTCPWMEEFGVEMLLPPRLKSLDIRPMPPP
mmetsp:Transcript_31697/g.62786  ORF Transcript_31697/g.62786 Transcript_31697/m.62786 type:complete len:116 (+) Transcript_31697:160-507(+)